MKTHKLIAICILAKFTEVVSPILYIATGCLDKGLGVALACLARWGGEACEFVTCAANFAAMHGNAKEAFQEIAEWC